MVCMFNRWCRLLQLKPIPFGIFLQKALADPVDTVAAWPHVFHTIAFVPKMADIGIPGRPTSSSSSS